MNEVFLMILIFKKKSYITWKVSKYGVFSDPCFPVCSPNTGKYGPEKTPYLDTFHAVLILEVGCLYGKNGLGIQIMGKEI